MDLYSHILTLSVVVSQVHGAGCHRLPRRNPPIWVHFHWNVSLCCSSEGFAGVKMIFTAGDVLSPLSSVFQVLHLHIFLGLQNLLRVRFHDAGPGHPVHCDCVCHHRVYILPAQCWRLQMVSFLFCLSLALILDFFLYFWQNIISLSRSIFTASLQLLLMFVSACFLFSRQWTSFLSAASTAVYVYMYSFYYYFFKTK